MFKGYKVYHYFRGMSYILAIDQGTSSTRTFLFDRQGSIVSIAQKEITPYFPKAGWVEQDAIEIWESVLETSRECVYRSGIAAEKYRA
jgi:glycerol kinase